jgi:hypothetical protein
MFWDIIMLFAYRYLVGNRKEKKNRSQPVVRPIVPRDIVACRDFHRDRFENFFLNLSYTHGAVRATSPLGSVLLLVCSARKFRDVVVQRNPVFAVRRVLVFHPFRDAQEFAVCIKISRTGGRLHDSPASSLGPSWLAPSPPPSPRANLAHACTRVGRSPVPKP